MAVLAKRMRIGSAALCVAGMATFAVFFHPTAVQARPDLVRPPRDPRPTPPSRPTRQPRATRQPGPHDIPSPTDTPTSTPQDQPTPAATPTATATAAIAPTQTPPIGPQSCPGVPVTCPQRPACVTGNRLGQLYYRLPVPDPIVTTRVSEMRLNANSNGIDPIHETGSFALVDKDNVTVLQMPRLDFVSDGNGGWIARNEHGWVSLVPKSAGSGYYFQLQYNDPNFPPGYFSVVYQMCLSIGDDGVYEQIVCQPHARDAFLCHSNGPTF
ncbi:MAG: hypothetical protein HY270_11065 [Deltaproteobacteria bacterium]|nr:hypothetical protein [Deltaproteobacteria bacterium]